jgi:hypothetical protein
MVRARKVNLLGSTDVDKINVRKDDYFSNAYIVDLPMDSEPDHVWQDIFNSEWRTSRNLWDRKAFIIGDKLRLITTPENMGEKINWVREVIAATNRGVETHYKQTRLKPRAKRETHQAQIEQEEALAQIRKALRSTLQK